MRSAGRIPLVFSWKKLWAAAAAAWLNAASSMASAADGEDLAANGERGGDSIECVERLGL